MTDQFEEFEWMKSYLNIFLIQISPVKMKELVGAQKFILRAKIALIKETLFNKNCNLLFVDTDTLYLKKIDNIFEKIEKGVCYLHRKEWALRMGRKKHPELCPVDLNFHLLTGTHITINESTQMWNSGVVGISSKQKEIISDALEFTDRYYKENPSWHVEQFSLSILLQRTFKLKIASDYIFHYWHSKELAKKFIDEIGKVIQENKSIKTFNELQRNIKIFVIFSTLNYNLHKLKVVISQNSMLYWIYCRIKKYIVIILA